MSNCIEQLKCFIESCPPKWRARNQWLEDDTLKVYVRYSLRLLDKKSDTERATCLDIAVICVDPGEWNKGHCRAFVTAAHELNPWDATFVECTNDPKLDAALPRWGFTFDGRDSYYKRTHNSE